MIEDFDKLRPEFSPAQQRAINKLKDMEWKSAYDIQESRNTLDALVSKGVLESRGGLGSMAFPRNNILYRLIYSADVTVEQS